MTTVPPSKKTIFWFKYGIDFDDHNGDSSKDGNSTPSFTSTMLERILHNLLKNTQCDESFWTNSQGYPQFYTLKDTYTN